MSKRFETKLNKILNDQEYVNCITDIFDSDPVKLMDTFIQHGSTTTFEHCMNVSYKSYKWAKRLKMDYKSAARAGLLHDLFLYDWHLLPNEKKFFKKHGFTHPQIALENATKYFDLNDREKNIISTHMWPLTLRKFPKYKESFLISIVDKYASCGETVVPYIDKIANYLL